jgi:hypothetical protein
MTHPIENMPITRGNFVDALVVDKDQAQADLAAAQKAAANLIAERDRLQAELADANRFKAGFADLFADQIDAAVKSAMLDYESDFDISAYESEIQEIARDGFDASDHSDDIADAVGFDMYDHKSDVADIVRDILRDATVKLEV